MPRGRGGGSFCRLPRSERGTVFYPPEKSRGGGDRGKRPTGTSSAWSCDQPRRFVRELGELYGARDKHAVNLAHHDHVVGGCRRDRESRALRAWHRDGHRTEGEQFPCSETDGASVHPALPLS